MGIQYFNTEEDMHDAFEELMEKQERSTRLEELILSQEAEVDDLRYRYREAEVELQDLQNELHQLTKELEPYT